MSDDALVQECLELLFDLELPMKGGVVGLPVDRRSLVIVR